MGVPNKKLRTIKMKCNCGFEECFDDGHEETMRTKCIMLEEDEDGHLNFLYLKICPKCSLVYEDN